MAKTLDRELRSSITPLEKLLFSSEALCVPGYQRPYRWSIRNVNQLLDDILQNKFKQAYRLGTVVLHNENGLNIVDGQQRILTLSMLAAELLINDKVAPGLNIEKLALAQHTIKDQVSLRNLKRNHAFIRNRIAEFDEDACKFFFRKCEFVTIELTDISEAFQFFDGQNSRGLDLKPHDLLKAFHLREMSGTEDVIMHKCVKIWEASSEQLPTYFSDYLYKVKRWSQGRSGINFSKNDIGIFKGIKPEVATNHFPYETGYRLVHRHSGHKLSGGGHSFPFQLDQPMVNGRRFFEFVGHYSLKIDNIKALSHDNSCPLFHELRVNLLSVKILGVLNSYKGRKRKGDRYLRNLLDCCLFYYEDKFGTYKIGEAFNRFFFWIYALRLEKFAVQEVTADALACRGDGFFRLIRDAVHPAEFLHREIKPVAYLGDKNAVADIEEIVSLFNDQQAI